MLTVRGGYPILHSPQPQHQAPGAAQGRQIAGGPAGVAGGGAGAGVPAAVALPDVAGQIQPALEGPAAASAAKSLLGDLPSFVHFAFWQPSGGEELIWDVYWRGL